MLRKREGLQNPVNVSGFHIILGLTTFPDGIFDALDSTHIHSFPFVVMMGLRVAAALDDASNMLKQYLEAGDIRFIGSTTYEEYNRYMAQSKGIVRPGIQKAVWSPVMAN